MCEPVTLSTIAIASAGVALAGAGISAYGQYQAGKYQQAVAEQNAQIARDEGALAEQRGAAAAGVTRMKESLVEGEARARTAASGIELSGSALDVIADSRMMSELDALTLKNNATREAWGYKVQAASSVAQGRLDALRGRYGAASTLIAGAAQAGSTYASGMRGPPGGGGGTSAGVLV